MPRTAPAVNGQGSRSDRPWRVGIRDPRGPADRSFAALDLTDAAMSTAGDYERFFIKDGKRYHHIIDPDLGEPAKGSRSVTIVTEKNNVLVSSGLANRLLVKAPPTDAP